MVGFQWVGRCRSGHSDESELHALRNWFPTRGAQPRMRAETLQAASLDSVPVEG